jgi:outer membrane lipoprotein-sorting protein
MISPSMRLGTVVLAALAIVTSVHASEPTIIAKARAQLGTETALNAVRSVHYTGSVISTDAADPTKQTRSEIDIIAQLPDQQRVVAKSDTMIETTVVDGYEGWQRRQDATNPANQRIIVFKPDAVKRLRAQAWENLAFFRGIERRGGRIEDQGTQTVDGVVCQKIAFIYESNIIFYRYFDVATGKLIQTETEDGGSTREEGEQIVNGVRFPKAMKMSMKGPKGTTQTVTVNLEKVTVNETFPATMFRIPSPGSP